MKEYWCIDWTGGINQITVIDGQDEYEENKKEIGNYFESKEEAKLALRKLKAWKQLKDDGITYSLDEADGRPFILIHSKEENGSIQKKVMRIVKNLLLLFGGEDD